MKTVRFSQVVEKCGQPEIYLLLSEDDPVFKKAVKDHRIMMLLGDNHRAKSHFGLVGYDAKQHGQILLFPRSLEAFEGLRIVGIKYELFADHAEAEEKTERAKRPPRPAKKKAAPSPKKKPKLSPKKEEAAPVSEKVIHFPREENENEDSEMEDLKSFARRALQALEKGHSHAAIHLLNRIIDY